MRKELIGIFLFFLVIFTLISLLSYSPYDPSINNVKTIGEVHNLFGVLGSYIADIFITLFGIASFFIPATILIISIRFFGTYTKKIIIYTLAGGFLLTIATGSLLSFHESSFFIFGSEFPSGGIAGIFLKSFLVKYSNLTGSVIILVLCLAVGFIFTTGFSIISISKRLLNIYLIILERIKTRAIMRKERKEKAIIMAEQSGENEHEIEIKALKTKPVRQTPVPKQDVFDFMRDGSEFRLPSVSFLDNPQARSAGVNPENLKMQSKLLEKKLEDFGVNGKVVAVTPGPVITTFEYEPAPGVKINKIVNLTDDLSLALRAISIRIEAPIPGKAVVGIEIPNADREMVTFKEVVVSGAFEKSKSKLTICLGKDKVGNPVVAELDKMPHLLIAGATGSGKSVALNTMICSLLYKSTPDEVKLLMVDPKRIELSMYDGIPHLITPVVTDVKKATNALFWAVHEMERRYIILSESKARNINQYQHKVAKGEKNEKGEYLEQLPLIVIIIDELADMMMVASRDVEVSLTRIAQMARAAGIHLILATQRPSVNVLTGIIKANFPTRLSFQVSSKTDSRTILDANGAESLLGNGDMLFMPPGTSRIQRIHGSYISEAEISKITEYLKKQKKPEYDEKITEARAVEESAEEATEYDERYDDAVALVAKTGHASISMIQRHLRIGYNRAARIIEIMEKEGVVGPSDGVKPREVLVNRL
ncbi:DNA translocase FtsK [Desulfobacterium sp. N47]|uniref:DNA translocase ftsK n=1 Tax=uncultured Desulfobacterium sp. TaxID=201089 RepID=E1YDM2_9BACT|nr:DNA translocase ftsK [uncultured Desulfobacterium sp.]